jgi:membrane associated rhomboid family serine protease
MSSSPAVHSAENQQPWVAYGLLVLCAVALMYSSSLERDIRSSAGAALGNAAAYWTERPYLEPADIIVERLTNEAIQSRRAEFERDRSGKGSIGVPKAVQSHYQEILDGLTAEALESLSQLPHYRMGVRVSKPNSVTYLTHAFLHSGWLHLIGNGILLLILGCYIERVWGHVLFGVFALVSSLAAATAFRIGNPELDAALIGTSGMIAGLLAAFTLRFASRWTEASYFSVIIGGLCWLTLPAGFGWGGSVIPGPTASGEMTGLANAPFWAIAGGFGCGFVITAMMMLGKIEATLFNTDATPAKKPSVDPDLEAALDAHANGRSEEAFELISALLQRNPDHRAALLAMWEVALDLGRPSDASRAMLRVIRDEVRRNAPSAVEHWLDLRCRGLHAAAEPALLIHIALMLCEADRRAEALTALERALEISAETESPEIAARVARASRSLDRGFTEAAAWHALSSMDLAYKDRQNLETLLAELHREAPEPPSQDGPRDDAGAAAHPGFSSERLGSDPRAEGRSSRPDDPGLPGAAGLPREGPLTAVGARGEGESTAEPAASVRPAPIDLEITSRALRVVRAQPSELAEDGLVIEIEGGDKRKIGFERIDAVSVVAVDGLGSKFVVVVDLVLNWMSESSEPLRVIRMRGDRFDPRQFSPGCDSPLDAMRSFTARLLEQSNATALPDTKSVQGTPFASFSDLASYQRTVLSVDEETEGDDPTELIGV